MVCARSLFQLQCPNDRAPGGWLSFFATYDFGILLKLPAVFASSSVLPIFGIRFLTANLNSVRCPSFRYSADILKFVAEVRLLLFPGDWGSGGNAPTFSTPNRRDELAYVGTDVCRYGENA